MCPGRKDDTLIINISLVDWILKMMCWKWYLSEVVVSNHHAVLGNIIGHLGCLSWLARSHIRGASRSPEHIRSIGNTGHVSPLLPLMSLQSKIFNIVGELWLSIIIVLWVVIIVFVVIVAIVVGLRNWVDLNLKCTSRWTMYRRYKFTSIHGNHLIVNVIQLGGRVCSP